jgi:transposase-like protein
VANLWERLKGSLWWLWDGMSCPHCKHFFRRTGNGVPPHYRRPTQYRCPVCLQKFEPQSNGYLGLGP